MTINEILEYVMTTPENTNGTILKQMLNELAAVDEEAIVDAHLAPVVAISGSEEYAAAADLASLAQNKVVFIYNPSTKSFTKIVGSASAES